MEMLKIEIENKSAVKINGEKWGYFTRESKGSRGAVYDLKDSSGRNVLLRPDEQRHTVTVAGDAIEKRNAEREKRKPRALEDRMAEAVSIAIQRKTLRSPDTLKAEAQAKQAERETWRKNEADRKRAAFDKEIDKVFAGLTVDEATAAIMRERMHELMDRVGAMAW
jgi:hypothetical protein